MFDHGLTFQSPSYLVLLALIPALWVWTYARLASLGPFRRIVALSMRSLVLGLLVLAMAEVQWVRKSDRLTVLYLLDQSLSIPPERREAMIDYVNRAVEEHLKNRDRAGVIVFGRDSAIEIPPVEHRIHIPGRIESPLDPENTNLAGALRLAQATFPEDAAKRIVIVSDGNENLGDAVRQAQHVSGAGVGIDVVPVYYNNRADVVVERLSAPGNLRPGQPFDLKVVVENTAEPNGGRSGEITGRLVVHRRLDDQSVELSNEPVSLPPGKKVFSIRQQGNTPGSYAFDVRFVPDRPEDDGIPQNNRATAIAHVHGKGRVLLIEDHENRGEFDHLAERLRKQDLEVTVQPTNRLFAELADLQPYDTVLLANVPREHFTDRQIEMLVGNTQDLGAGLVMLGGPNSFGAGGWTNTAVEKAMPVDFQIKNLKVVPSGAIVLVIDRSGSMSGEKLELCKAAALATVKTLGERDYVGVVVFDSDADWAVRMTRAGNRDAIARRIRNIGIGGGTNMRPGMELGHRGLVSVNTAVKHMVVLTDGQTMGEGYSQLAARIRKDDITISTVAVGEGADVPLLDRIAHIGGGKLSRVRNPKALPRIFMQEARRIARPLIYKNDDGVRPTVQYNHDMVRGLEDALPPIRGFVMTTLKQNPLVEVSLLSPLPKDERNSSILASWLYGSGRAVALTTDAGARWATDWTGWENYDKLFGQIVRWSMRPTDSSGKYTVSTRIEDGEAEVAITALDKDDEFLNFLSPAAGAIGPDLRPIDLRIEQTAPGRYVGRFPADKVGSYFVLVSPRVGEAPLRVGLNVPYSREFRDRSTNKSLLTEMATMTPRGGKPGEIIEAEGDVRDDSIEPLLAVNPFRRDLKRATSYQEAWHYLAFLAGCLFFFDVFVRRVQVSFAWVRPAVARVGNLVLRRTPEAASPEVMGRLRSRKAEVSGQLDKLREASLAEGSAAARFEALGETADGSTALDELPKRSDRKPGKQPSPSIAAEAAPKEETYTERLLRAKQKVWEGRETPKQE
ncbi:MAG: VWA domain-containing protein [Pirellulaceae bacterium]|nr:VWA domain-containing protein [Pirellulaceae bacterium]